MRARREMSELEAIMARRRKLVDGDDQATADVDGNGDIVSTMPQQGSNRSLELSLSDLNASASVGGPGASSTWDMNHGSGLRENHKSSTFSKSARAFDGQKSVADVDLALILERRRRIADGDVGLNGNDAVAFQQHQQQQLQSSQNSLAGSRARDVCVKHISLHESLDFTAIQFAEEDAIEATSSPVNMLVESPHSPAMKGGEEPPMDSAQLFQEVEEEEVTDCDEEEGHDYGDHDDDVGVENDESGSRDADSVSDYHHSSEGDSGAEWNAAAVAATEQQQVTVGPSPTPPPEGDILRISSNYRDDSEKGTSALHALEKVSARGTRSRHRPENLTIGNPILELSNTSRRRYDASGGGLNVAGDASSTNDPASYDSPVGRQVRHRSTLRYEDLEEELSRAAPGSNETIESSTPGRRPKGRKLPGKSAHVKKSRNEKNSEVKATADRVGSSTHRRTSNMPDEEDDEKLPERSSSPNRLSPRREVSSWKKCSSDNDFGTLRSARSDSPPISTWNTPTDELPQSRSLPIESTGPQFQNSSAPNFSDTTVEKHEPDVASTGNGPNNSTSGSGDTLSKLRQPRQLGNDVVHIATTSSDESGDGRKRRRRRKKAFDGHATTGNLEIYDGKGAFQHGGVGSKEYGGLSFIELLVEKSKQLQKDAAAVVIDFDGHVSHTQKAEKPRRLRVSDDVKYSDEVRYNGDASCDLTLQGRTSARSIDRKGSADDLFSKPNRHRHKRRGSTGTFVYDESAANSAENAYDQQNVAVGDSRDGFASRNNKPYKVSQSDLPVGSTEAGSLQDADQGGVINFSGGDGKHGARARNPKSQSNENITVGDLILAERNSVGAFDEKVEVHSLSSNGIGESHVIYLVSPEKHPTRRRLAAMLMTKPDSRLTI